MSQDHETITLMTPFFYAALGFIPQCIGCRRLRLLVELASKFLIDDIIFLDLSVKQVYTRFSIELRLRYQKAEKAACELKRTE